MRTPTHNPISRCLTLVLLILGLAEPSPLLAQESGRARTLAVVVREGASADLQRPLTLRLVADSMVAAVPDSPVTLVLSDYGGPVDLGTLQAIAAGAGAQVLLLATVNGTDAEITVELQAVSSRNASVLGAATFADRLDSAYRILFGRFWSELPGFLASLPPVSDTGILRVVPDGAGLARVMGIGRRRASPGAPAEFQLPAPASYRVTVNRDGHYPETVTLLLEPGSTVELTPVSVALPRVVVDAGLQSLGFPRATVSWIPGSNGFAVGIGMVSYAGGLNPFFSSGLDLPFTVVPLLELLGTISVPPLGPGLLATDSGVDGTALALQPSLELGLRLNLAEGPLVDAVIPLVLRFPLDLELQVSRGRAFWLRISPTLFLLGDPDAGSVLLSSASTIGPRPIAVGSVGVQALDPSFGFRMAF